jgi:hypothetical protein
MSRRIEKAFILSHLIFNLESNWSPSANLFMVICNCFHLFYSHQNRNRNQKKNRKRKNRKRKTQRTILKPKPKSKFKTRKRAGQNGWYNEQKKNRFCKKKKKKKKILLTIQVKFQLRHCLLDKNVLAQIQKVKK